MSGLLILLAVSFLFDEPLPAPVPTVSRPAVTLDSKQVENLPAPRSVASAVQATKLISSNAQIPAAQPGADEAKVGWGVDSADGTMYMVIQIAPSAIETFAAGQRGQELASRIPTMLRNRIEKVIIRFGTGPVEQFPSESELASMPLPRNSSPHVANLDMRSPVSIDAPRNPEAVLTASTTQIPIVPSNVLPSTSMPNNGYPPPLTRGSPTSNEVFPSNVAPPVGGSSLINTPQLGGATQWNNNTPPVRSSVPTANNGFTPLGNNVPSTLNPFGSPRATPTFGNTAPTNGNVTYSGTNSSSNNYGNNPYGNTPMVASNPNAGIYPPAANTPILPPNYPGTLTNNNNFNNNPNLPYAQNPSQLANGSNYGVPVSANTPTYAGGGYAAGGTNQNMGAVMPPPLLASRDLHSTGGSVNNQLPSRNPNDDRFDNRELFGSNRPGSLVPFFLVLSFILNVYFGLWLNHLRTKYRHLLGNARGISPLEMDRA